MQTQRQTKTPDQRGHGHDMDMTMTIPARDHGQDRYYALCCLMRLILPRRFLQNLSQSSKSNMYVLKFAKEKVYNVSPCNAALMSTTDKPLAHNKLDPIICAIPA